MAPDTEVIVETTAAWRRRRTRTNEPERFEVLAEVADWLIGRVGN